MNKKNLIIFTIFIMLISCIQKPTSNGLGGVVDEEIEYNEVMSKDSTDIEINDEIIKEDSTTLEQFTDQLIDVLSNNNLTEFAQYFHPEKGTYFSPYTFLDTMGVNYKTDEFITDLNQNKVILWGRYDGSGDPIELTIKDYFKQFVYPVDFKTLTTRKNINSKLAFSNTLNNIKSIFPDAQYVEYYYKGSGNYDGMDWSSLIFYIEKYQGNFYLVAVVHNEWTI